MLEATIVGVGHLAAAVQVQQQTSPFSVLEKHSFQGLQIFFVQDKYVLMVGQILGANLAGGMRETRAIPGQYLLGARVGRLTVAPAPGSAGV
jgi:hypothetical protein